jgi:Tfp pilus assembly protein PilF
MRKYLILLLALTACDSPEVRTQRFLLQGNQALAAQEYAGAQYYFEEAIKLNPCFTEALNNLGTLQSKQKHFAEAIDFFSKAIACDRNFLPAYFNRANAYYDGKEYFSLMQDADYILSLKPDTVVGHVLRGLAQTKLKQYTEAHTSFTKAIAQEPNKAEHWVNRGTTQYYQKNWSGAGLDFRKALQLQPNQPNAINALGLLAIEQNKLDSAEFRFKQALAIQIREPYFMNNLGFVYLLQNKTAQGENLINESIMIDPDNAWAYRNKGIFYLAVADFVSAERLLGQALKMDGSVDRIHFYYGQALVKTKKSNEACEQFQLSQKLNEGMVTNELKTLCGL